MHPTTSIAPPGSSLDDRVDALFASGEVDHDGVASCREQVVLEALDVADAIAARYQGRGVDLDDLRQVARLALVLAANRYDPSRGSGFTAFAVPTILGEVKRHFRDQGWVVRPPRSVQEGRGAVVAAQDDLRHLLSREPTTAEVADLLGCAPAAVVEARLCGSGFRPASLDTPLTGSGQGAGITLGETLADPEESFTPLEVRDMLRDAMGLLDTRERLIVRLRFREELSQSSIGALIGVSQMQVSRILTSILARLRAHVESTLAA